MSVFCTNYSKNRFFIKHQPLLLGLSKQEAELGIPALAKAHLFKGVRRPVALMKRHVDAFT